MAEEYISRKAAKDAIFDYICGHTMSKFPSKELLMASKKGAEGAFNEIDYVPTADVVPRAMIAEIFGEMKKAIKEEVCNYCNGFEKAETHELQEYFKTKQNTAIFLYMKIDHLEKKYTGEER